MTIDWIKTGLIYVFIVATTLKKGELKWAIYIYIYMRKRSDIWVKWTGYIYIYSQTRWQLSEFRQDIYMFSQTHRRVYELRGAIYVLANKLTIEWIKTVYIYIRVHNDKWVN